MIIGWNGDDSHFLTVKQNWDGSHSWHKDQTAIKLSDESDAVNNSQ